MRLRKLEKLVELPQVRHAKPVRVITEQVAPTIRDLHSTTRPELAQVLGCGGVKVR